MNIVLLREKCRAYEEQEGRAGYYDIALEIVNEHPIQAVIIILSTWNSSRFHYMANLAKVKLAIEKCIPLLREIADITFQAANFNVLEKAIEDIYGILSVVKGIEYTGASKVMHLLSTELFVMWDGAIREEYGCNNTAEAYITFLKKMQEKFRDIVWNVPDKTLPKAIDEYNYVTITLRKRKK